MKGKAIAIRPGSAAVVALAAVAALAAAVAALAVTLGLALAPALRGGPRNEQAWIPLRDGVRLAATLYMPEGARPGERFPALLEYLPYRKDDGTAARDFALHAYFARHRYVTARVDIRGTGRSEGRPPDREYSEQEQQDGLEVIAWLARQPWSTGKVGMFGISWGGFNSIQHAMRRPPELRAILAIEATDDLFQDDIHFIDGLMHVDEYELSMDLQPALSPSPDYPLDEAILEARFDNPPWSLLYKRQQRDGAFWGRASLNRRYDAIDIPVFLIGGWLDGYRDSVPRMLQRVKTPVKAIIGPWNHDFPDQAVPGPTIEWRHEAVRFWDHWLKGRDTGIKDEPRLAVYMRHWHPPDPNLQEIPGEWRWESGWPPRDSRDATYYLAPDHALRPAPPSAASHDLRYVPSAGAEAGFWWGELTPDQRPADAFSLVYDTAPLEEDVAILGFPRALLRASATAPLAHWFARLSDVAPDGSVTLVTGAGLNGAHRESAEHPEPLEPGRVYPLEIEMHVTSWIFPRGHRIRLAVSNSMWPMIWPTPHPMTTSLHLGGEGGSRLVLPVVPRESAARPRFLPPEPNPSPLGVRSSGSTWPGQHAVRRDVGRAATRVEWSGAEATEYPWGRLTDSERLTYDVTDNDPARAFISGQADTSVALAGRVLTWRGALQVRSDATNFYYQHRRELLKDGVVVRERTWEETIPRDHQ
jgi:predicted acyl esterase